MISAGGLNCPGKARMWRTVAKDWRPEGGSWPGTGRRDMIEAPAYLAGKARIADHLRPVEQQIVIIENILSLFRLDIGGKQLEADLSRIVAQEPRADPMKSPGPKRIGHDAGVIADQPAHDSLDTPRHLGGGLARQGHQQDFAGIGTIDDQVGHPVRQGVSLAGP